MADDPLLPPHRRQARRMHIGESNSTTRAGFKLFYWLASRGSCLTADNLRKQGWPNQTYCPLCSVMEETCTHLFSTCTFTIQVWALLFTGGDVFAWWMAARKILIKPHRRKMDAVVIIVSWRIWKE
uniref:Reverse transcriptase zinc-binding domain-containing protein n=1 Tax=Oryza punctata TaxID=4537 RepID=A0A0E0JTD7_ORYPU